MILSFTLTECKTKAAFSAKLQKPKKLDLSRIKRKFESILETPILLVIKEEEIEVIVHSYGELLFKNCKDIQLMQKIARRIYEIGLA